MTMRKHLWIAVIALIASTIAFIGCEEMKKMADPIMPEPEPPTEMVETPTEPTEVIEPPVETPPEMEPEMPEEPMVVEPTTPVIEGPIVSVSPAQITSPAVGAQLQVSINIAQVANVTGYDFTLAFDSTALQHVESSNADYLPAGAFPIPVTVSGNKISLGAVSTAGPALASSGTLATITFEVIAAKASTLTLQDVVFTDNGTPPQEISPTTVDAEISAP